MSATEDEVSIIVPSEAELHGSKDPEQMRRNARLDEYMREKERERIERENESSRKAAELRKQKRTTATVGLRNTIRNGLKDQKSSDSGPLSEVAGDENAEPHAQRQSVAFSMSTSASTLDVPVGHSKAIRQLESKCEELQRQLQSKEAELRDLQAAYARLNEEQQLSQVTVEKMQAYNDDLEKEIKDSVSLMKQMENWQEALKIELESVKNEAHRQQTTLQRELLDLQGKLRQAKQELAETRDHLTLAEQKLQAGLLREKELARTLDDMTAEHQQALDEVIAERNGLVSDLALSSEKSEKLSRQLEERNQDLATMTELNETLSTAIEDHKANEIHLRSDVTRLQDREEQLTEKLDESTASVAKLHEIIKGIEADAKEQQQRYEITIRELQASAAQLQARIDSMSAQMHELEESNRASAAENTALTNELTGVKNELVYAVEEHRTKQAALQNNLEEMTSKYHQQSSQLQEKDELLAAAQQALAASQSATTNLSEQLASITEQLQEREASLRETQEKLQLHELGEKDSNAQKTEYIRRTNALQAEVDRYRTNEQALTAEKEQLDLELVEIKAQSATEKAELQNSLCTVQTEAAGLREQLAAMTARLADAESAIARLCARELDLLEKRRFLNNRVLQLQGNIRVFVRVRPAKPGSPRQRDEPAHYRFPPCLRADDKGEIEVCEMLAKTSSIGNAQPRERKHKFAFDKVFAPDASQEVVYNELAPLIQSVVDGYSVCLLAYGQTSSGKTYTMIGQHEAVLTSGTALESKDSSDESVAFDDSDADSTTSASIDNRGGVIVRAARTLFELLDEMSRHGWSGDVSVSVLEVYNDTIRDLTIKSREDSTVTIRHNTDGSIEVVGARTLPVRSAEDIVRTVRIAMTKRCKKSTKMNADSSRSHCVFQINLRMVNSETGAERNGTLHVVDLAGSERVRVSGSIDQPDLLKEAKCINRSLSALGNVFNAMYRKERHIPFRDSTITHLLQPCLQKDCKVLLICNIAPETASLSESLSTLRFARKVNETTPTA